MNQNLSVSLMEEKTGTCVQGIELMQLHIFLSQFSSSGNIHFSKCKSLSAAGISENNAKG